VTEKFNFVVPVIVSQLA